MSKNVQEKNESKKALKTENGLTLTLSEETLEKIRKQVSVDSNAAIYGLVSDAINSYLQLGNLSASGAKMFAGTENGENLTRLRLPFEQSFS